MSDDKLSKAIENSYYIADSLKVLKEIYESGDCNDCKEKYGCEWEPKAGQLVRYNCPHYQKIKSIVPKYEKLPKLPRFEILDKETGKQVDLFEIKELQKANVTGWMYISENGMLIAEGSEQGSIVPLPKDKYIVRIGTVMYRW